MYTYIERERKHIVFWSKAGRDQEGLFSGEESEEYKKLLNQIKNRRHYKSLIESGNNPAEALSIAIEAVKEQEKEK